jgi:Ni/Fe-hydrogenase subunit HybB-like protein
MTTHANLHQPLRKPFDTPGVLILSSLFLLAVAIAAYRFFFGLSAVTNLDNRYPWGIWIALDVATGVALAAGGFTTAALVHVFHRKHYEVVIRPALLTALLGYTFVALGLLVDLGRYYNIWHPMLPSMWQGNSALFEVGMCVMAYLTVLYIEFMPMLCERFVGKVRLPGWLGRLNSQVDFVLRLMRSTLSKVMFLFLIAGVVLSCMHQSSLGTLMLIAPYKVHPLWYTPMLPFLFLLSAIAVGFPMVVIESIWASKSFGRKPEMNVLAPLSKFVVFLLGIYLAAKATDLLVREAHVYLFDRSFQSKMFWLEIGVGAILPLALLLSERARRTPALLFLASLSVVAGVVINRLNVFLIAYQPGGTGAVYFPSMLEILFTIGMIAGLALVYRVIVTIFPVLPAEEEGPSPSASVSGMGEH